MNGAARRFLLIVAGIGLGACAHTKSLPKGQALSPQERLDAIRRAEVWFPTDIPSMDIAKGPDGGNPFPADGWVECDYKEKKMSGQSLKFTCVGKDGEDYKVKYGDLNAEVYGEVLATRLFWALGFPADRMYPVRVRCRGCSSDPKHNPATAAGVFEFDPAAIERKLPGRPMEIHEDSGWTFGELDVVGPDSPPDARAHRDALKLLAAFLQHTDNKAPNQRVLCPAGQGVGATGCRQPVLLIQDLGLTFGQATLLNKNKNSVSLENWSEVPVWKDPKTCVARLKGSFTGSISDPEISEAGRSFLAGLLSQLSDAQLRALFEFARVTRRSAAPSSHPDEDSPAPSVEAWVAAFKTKRAEILEHRCPR